MDRRIAEIRKVLEALARVENSDNDTKELVYDRELAKIRELDRDGIIDIVSLAVGSNKRRLAYASFIFAELYDVPGIESVFGDLLKNADATARSNIIQTIGLRKMHNLVGVLNEHFIHEYDDFCRDCLLHSLAKLADPSSLPIFEYLMRRNYPRDEWRLIVAGGEYGVPAFRDYLLTVFENPEKLTSHRVVAAWGLVKIGHDRAHRYLIEMLDDPDVTTPRTYKPGQSIRAAQAIADINGWEFEWGKMSVETIKRRLATSNRNT